MEAGTLKIVLRKHWLVFLAQIIVLGLGVATLNFTLIVASIFTMFLLWIVFKQQEQIAELLERNRVLLGYALKAGFGGGRGMSREMFKGLHEETVRSKPINVSIEPQTYTDADPSRSQRLDDRKEDMDFSKGSWVVPNDSHVGKTMWVKGRRPYEKPRTAFEKVKKDMKADTMPYFSESYPVIRLVFEPTKN